ncbi:hypothetical protein CGCFRS4_v015826 [Colletotrichum fructicola]|nr:hypothetical protein CGCFRS4_v015826 [Colletotrichum fructicola]
MAAYCRTTTGNWTWSVLDLNHCLVNNNGTLIAQDEGYFFLTADSCSSDNATTSWANYKCSTKAIERSGGNIDHDIDLSTTQDPLHNSKQLTIRRWGGW